MRARPTRALPAAAVVPAAFVLCAFAAAASPPGGRVVITGEMLQSAALTRLSDVLLLVDDWVLSTTDGYTWKAAPNGLSTFREQQWVVMLDGQRVDLNLFDAVNLNLLPVALDQIDSVVVVNTPQLYDGEFSDRGLIHFYTRRPQGGETYGISLMGGGETGDPGPYRYTRYRTANVDGDGPDASVAFGHGRENWSLYTSASVQHFYFTDAAVRPRTADALPVNPEKYATGTASNPSAAGGISRVLNTGTDDTWPGMLRYAVSAGLSRHGASGFHHSFVGYSKAQKYYLYSEPFGRELPTDNRYFHAGVNGEFYLAGKTTLAYRLRYSSNRLSRHDNRLGFDYDWETGRAGASAWFTARAGYVGIEIGAGMDETWISTGYALEEDERHAGRVYGSLTISPDHRVEHRIGLLAEYAGPAPSLKAFWNSTWAPHRSHRFEAECSFAQRDFAENEDLWYWTTRGYEVLEDNGVTFTIPGGIDQSNTAAADVTWYAGQGGAVGLGLGGLYRYFSDWYLDRQYFTLDAGSCALYSRTDVSRKLKGQALGGKVQVSYEPSPRLHGRLYFRHLGMFSGDEALKQEWRTIPERKIVLHLTWKPFDDVFASARISRLSAARWKSYEGIAGLACAGGLNSVSYSYETGGSTVLDLKVRKLLLGGKLSADLICRNVWNAENRYHPVGAIFDLSFFVFLDFKYHSG